MLRRSLTAARRWKCFFPAQTSRSIAVTTRALSMKHYVQNVQTDGAAKMLHICWENNTVNRFPYIFLRDNCQCEECFQASTKRRIFDTVGEADVDIEAKQVKVLQDGKHVLVIWPDEHQSVFEASWLHKRCLPEETDRYGNKKSIVKEGVVLWDRAKLQDRIPCFEYQELMQEDRMLMNWLVTLHSHGISMVKKAPNQLGSLKQLADRVGYLKPTYLGEVWHVRSQYQVHMPSLNTIRESSLQTDLPHCQFYPGIQLLHCSEQAPSTGGSSIFSDSFSVSQKFKEAEPEFFQLLTEVPISYTEVSVNVYGDCNMQCSRPVIKLDHSGNITEFSYNEQTRDSFPNMSPDDTQDVYEAYVTLGRMLRDPANLIEHKMSPGEIMVFNNLRVLHGRSELTITHEGKGLLEGGYISWDAAYSKLRVLAEKFNKDIDV